MGCEPNVQEDPTYLIQQLLGSQDEFQNPIFPSTIFRYKLNLTFPDLEDNDAELETKMEETRFLSLALDRCDNTSKSKIRDLMSAIEVYLEPQTVNKEVSEGRYKGQVHKCVLEIDESSLELPQTLV